MTAGLLLAAGAGRRYGRPKALVELDGEPLVRRAIRLLARRRLRARARGARRGRRRGARPARRGAGPARSLARRAGLVAARGLASLPADVPAAVVVLVDQPLLSPVAVRRVRAAYADGAVVAVATYAGRPGHPMLLTRRTWPLLSGTPSATGAPATCCATGRTWWSRCPVTTSASPVDVDTPADLLRLRPVSDG